MLWQRGLETMQDRERGERGSGSMGPRVGRSLRLLTALWVCASLPQDLRAGGVIGRYPWGSAQVTTLFKSTLVWPLLRKAEALTPERWEAMSAAEQFESLKAHAMAAGSKERELRSLLRKNPASLSPELLALVAKRLRREHAWISLVEDPIAQDWARQLERKLQEFEAALQARRPAGSVDSVRERLASLSRPGDGADAVDWANRVFDGRASGQGSDERGATAALEAHAESPQPSAASLSRPPGALTRGKRLGRFIPVPGRPSGREGRRSDPLVTEPVREAVFKRAVLRHLEAAGAMETAKALRERSWQMDLKPRAAMRSLGFKDVTLEVLQDAVGLGSVATALSPVPGAGMASRVAASVTNQVAEQQQSARSVDGLVSWAMVHANQVPTFAVAEDGAMDEHGLPTAAGIAEAVRTAYYSSELSGARGTLGDPTDRTPQRGRAFSKAKRGIPGLVRLKLNVEADEAEAFARNHALAYCHALKTQAEEKRPIIGEERARRELAAIEAAIDGLLHKNFPNQKTAVLTRGLYAQLAPAYDDPDLVRDRRTEFVLRRASELKAIRGDLADPGGFSRLSRDDKANFLTVAGQKALAATLPPDLASVTELDLNRALQWRGEARPGYSSIR